MKLLVFMILTVALFLAVQRDAAPVSAASGISVIDAGQFCLYQTAQGGLWGVLKADLRIEYCPRW